MLLTALLGVGLALTMLMRGLLTKEPTLNGRHLHTWVTSLAQLDPAENDQAAAAIAQAGTNALQFLLEWIQYERPPWRARLADLVQNLPPVTLSLPLSERIHFGPRYYLADGTVAAFAVLKTNAAPVLQDLVKLMNDPAAPETAMRATRALRFLGTNALPALLRVVQNPRHPCGLEALLSIRGMPNLQETHSLAIPALLACLNDHYQSIKVVVAAQILGDLRAAPDLCVPELTACLSSNQAAQARSAAAQALGKFKIDARSAVPTLNRSLKDNNTDVRLGATAALEQIAPEVLTNNSGQLLLNQDAK